MLAGMVKDMQTELSGALHVPVSHKFCQLGVAVAGKQFYAVGGHDSCDTS
jgi:hypothetical protein